MSNYTRILHVLNLFIIQNNSPFAFIYTDGDTRRIVKLWWQKKELNLCKRAFHYVFVFMEVHLGAWITALESTMFSISWTFFMVTAGSCGKCRLCVAQVLPREHQTFEPQLVKGSRGSQGLLTMEHLMALRWVTCLFCFVGNALV